MMTWLRDILATSPRRGTKSRGSTRPAVESLEGRQLLTVTYQGGNVLSHVEVQGLYLGSDFVSIPAANQQTGYVDGFLRSVVNSTFVDAIGNAYTSPYAPAIGRGTFSQGIITPATLPRSNTGVPLNDSAIRSYLQSDISGRYLQQPDANRLYVVFVEANVVVRSFAGNTSSSNDPNGFLGYHTAFTGFNANGQLVPIRYAVVAYPGGANGSVQGYAGANDQTEVASHEIAEAITDPDVNYGRFGWNDNTFGEVGDITNGQVAFLNGYAIQRISDPNDHAMTPAGATSSRPVSFFLNSSGYLYETSSSGLSLIATGVASLGGEGVDTSGHAMVDYVTSSGFAYEFHDGSGPIFLTSGARSADAGQGVSYVLLTNGSLYEQIGSSAQYPRGSLRSLGSGVASISAGTDRYGVSTVDFVSTNGFAYELSDTSGLHYLTSGVRTISASQQGISEILLQNGQAVYHSEASGVFSVLATNVAVLTSGTDVNGANVIDLIYNNGDLYEYRSGPGWSLLSHGVYSVGKARGSVVDLVLSNGIVEEHGPNGWTYLGSNGLRVS